MRRWPIGCVVTIVMGCGSFGATSSTTSDGGTTSEAGGSSSGTVMDAASGRALDYVCPAAGEPKLSLAEANRQTIYQNGLASGESRAIFAIATDSSSIYWVEQHSTEPTVDVYDGDAPAEIRRQRKGAATSDVLVDGEPRADRIALKGEWIYWTTIAETKSSLRRVQRDCMRPCTAETVLGDMDFGRVLNMASAGPNEVLLQDGSGNLVGIDLEQKRLFGRGSGGEAPSLVVGTNSAFTASPKLGEVRVLDFTSPGPATSFASAKAVVQLQTDCTDVFALTGESDPRTILRSSIAARKLENPFPSKTFDLGNVYASTVDGSFIYVVSADGGGVHAIDKASGEMKQIYAGNVWFIAVDGAGVYFAEHAHNSRPDGALFYQPR